MTLKIKLTFVFILLALVFQVLSATSVVANGDANGDANVSPGQTLNNVKNDPVILTNPLGEGASLQSVIGKIISAVLGVVGSIALAMFVYGGFLWMTAMGNSSQIDKGKNVLTWATIGLVVIFSSYALVQFVIKGVTGS